MGIADRSFNSNVEKMKANKYVEGLIRALKDKERSVRRRATYALGDIGDSRAVKPLTETLDEDWHVRRSAADALENIR